LTSSGLAITQDWFTHNIPLWNWALSKHLQIEAPLRVLEIGSFEGLSTRFLLSKLPSSQITCVDTFSGSLEHKGDDDKGFIDFDLVKGRFDHNTSGFESRLTVERRTSLEFLASLDPAELFDMVYIDGSHEADDVLLDAILSFKHLRPGGLIVFDDYMWEFYPVRADNPGAAINSFLSLKRHELEIVYVGWQVIVKRRQGQRTLGYGAHPRGV
jgi:predicted O-methyltransferase YrrM